MASSINASTSGAGGLITTADNTGILQLKTAGTTAVTVDASQNVTFDTDTLYVDATNNRIGIKTTIPSSSFHINAGNACFSFNDNSISLQNKLSWKSESPYFDETAYIGGYRTDVGGAPTDMTFGTGTASGVSERMRIDSAGRVMINGTNAASTWHYTGKFHVKSDAASGSTVMSVRYGGTSAFTNISIENDNGRVGYIQTSGTSTTYSTSSDYRLKENILPMTNALDKIMLLNPVTFTWKNDGSNGQGFIAHELQAVVPDCVGGTKDAIREDGTPDYQGVDTSFLVATLTAAIKELTARVIALENK